MISVEASYYRLNVEIHTEFPGSVAVSRCETVGGVVRGCDPVAKLKSAQIFFPGVFVGGLQKILCLRNVPTIQARQHNLTLAFVPKSCSHCF